VKKKVYAELETAKGIVSFMFSGTVRSKEVSEFVKDVEKVGISYELYGAPCNELLSPILTYHKLPCMTPSLIWPRGRRIILSPFLHYPFLIRFVFMFFLLSVVFVPLASKYISNYG
jgi:hypothetical protein